MTPLPADTHVHSEFSWDTGGASGPAAGTMRRTCARAVRIGLPALAFTDHLDLSGWRAAPEDFAGHQRVLIREGLMQPPPLDVEGYLDSIERCRHEFPELRVLTGVELGQPHLDGEAAGGLLDLSELDRVNGSLHTVPFAGHRSEPVTLFRLLPDPAEVVWAYLREVPVMVDGGTFDVFTHIDYAARYWPTDEHGPFDHRRFEDGFREALRAIASSGRALELNTGRPVRPWIPQWWAEEGGRAISFGSDDHATSGLAANFPEATALAAHHGFRPGRRAEDYWTR
ncbi:PHP domain-containing protein [Desertihabitans brevis]|uniref:PHP domain-containing protein n=1 Tax=Desertihabitans brevis TaxID=2268447 RepID=A0A367YVE1_9ACTN|nr:PHP domain-containing protein [Desertihabitans brevis]RCK68921.1 PHP domain-containing protein [Desertihabitans brevis]